MIRSQRRSADTSAASIPGGASPAYPWYWKLVPLIGGIVDPLWGLCVRLAGCFCRAPRPARVDSERRRRRGLTVVLGGIEGPSHFNHQMVTGILRSGYRGSVVRFDWNAGPAFWRSLVNLAGRAHHGRQARRLVEYICHYHDRYPAAPICLLAQSGGCWIAVRALETLPACVPIQAAIVLAPSISPSFDIRTAAARCASALVSIGGPGDWFFLGLGTLLLGTSDRVFTPSAGLLGWHHHAERFVECRWRPAWLGFGHLGNHTTSASPSFIAAVIGPLLRAAPAGPGKPALP